MWLSRVTEAVFHAHTLTDTHAHRYPHPHYACTDLQHHSCTFLLFSGEYRKTNVILIGMFLFQTMGVHIIIEEIIAFHYERAL